MGVDDERLGRAAAAILDAASGQRLQDRLGAVTEALRALLGPVDLLAFTYDPRQVLATPAVRLRQIDMRREWCWGSDAAAAQFMKEEYPRWAPLDPVPAIAAVRTHEAHAISWSPRGRTAYWAEFLTRLPLVHELVAGLQAFTDQGLAFLVYRGPGQERFSRVERLATEVLYDHVLFALRGLMLRDQLGEIEREAGGWAVGALVLSGRGELVRTEGAAHALLASIDMSGEVLSGWLVQQALELVSSPPARSPEERVFALPATDGGWIEARVSRLGAPPEVALVVLRRLDAGTEEPFAAVTAAHRLTPREREVARLIVLGLSNREVAQELGVRPRTVAAHLLQVYSKLGVCDRQGLKVRVLGSA